MAQHTPGPWLHAGPIGAGIYVVSNTRPIAVVYGPNGEAAPEANALLIAAAPDLLEALWEARAVLDEEAENRRMASDVPGYLQPIEKALAKIDAAILKTKETK